MKNYSMEVFRKSWQDVIEKTMNDFGSWRNRTGYNKWVDEGKMKVLLEGPMLTRSGYGEHTELVYQSLKSIENLDIYSRCVDFRVKHRGYQTIVMTYMNQ